MTGHQFAVCRLLLGTYLLCHFIGLIPHGAELFSRDGMLPRQDMLPTWGTVPHLFWISDTPAMVYGVLSLGMASAVCLILGVQRRIAALMLWLVWMSLFNRNPLISNPSIPFIGLTLLLIAALPNGEPWSRSQPVFGWQVPEWVCTGLLWILMGGYTLSGLHKLNAPSWVDGSALTHVLNLPIARDYFLRDWILEIPSVLTQWATWFALAMEILALPLTLLKPSRRWIWLGLFCMNAGILFVVDFADLTLGILLVHLFTADRAWLAPAAMKTEHPVVYFDGVCNLCNHAVDFIVAEDRQARFRYAPIQGTTAEAIEAEEVKSGESMALQDGDALYTKSDAVLRVAAGLGGMWRVLSWARWVPTSIRDAVYFQVQKNRLKVFGERETCRLPSPEERTLFLP